MDFNLSPEHLLIRKMMAEFTENEVKPIAAETDAKTLYPRENIEKLFDLGVMGMCIPKEYGGQGADPLASAICIEVANSVKNGLRRSLMTSPINPVEADRKFAAARL